MLVCTWDAGVCCATRHTECYKDSNEYCGYKLILCRRIYDKQLSSVENLWLPLTPLFLPFYSATEEEISLGIFSAQGDPNETSFWLKRTFTDLLEQKPSDVALPTFADLTLGKRGLEFDVDSAKTLNHLKEAKMPATYVG